MQLNKLDRDEQTNIAARSAALKVLDSYTVKSTSTVNYTSGDSLLVLADKSLTKSVIELICERFEKNKLLIVFIPGNRSGQSIDSMPEDSEVHYEIVDNHLQLRGHLGNFQVQVERDGQEINLGLSSQLKKEYFDVVLDLSETPVLEMAVVPFGYVAACRDQQDIDLSLTELEGLQGQFQKPKYFAYDKSICAHTSSGITGCQNCIQSCPAEAISSTDFKISVDPYLCQGCGTCTSVCPTGAMTYAYPPASDTLNRIRLMLGKYFDAKGRHPCIIFYESALRDEIVDQSCLPGHALPYEVEEVTSVGMEVWLAALAYGADHVFLMSKGETDPNLWMEQLVFAREILQGMGHTEPRLHVVDPGDTSSLVDKLQELPLYASGDRAKFIGLDEKRTIIRLAVEHLHEYAPMQQREISLSKHAPFGKIEVDREACTLCMSCASLCPKGAISAGGDTPILKFVESECVQCGLCESGCPENAIQLFSRYLYDREDSFKPVILNEEKVFSCISCGKPFATYKMINTITEKLKDHYMFQGERIKQLQMCEDCKVKVQFDSSLANQ